MRQFANELLVGIGIGSAQLMIHMQDRQGPQIAGIAQLGSRISQRRRVGPARNHEQHGCERRRQFTMQYRASHGFSHIHDFHFLISHLKLREITLKL